MVNFLEKDELDREVRRGLNMLGLKIRSLTNSRHPRRRIDSIRYAIKGILHALVNEPNFRIQLFIALGIFVIGTYLKISTIEWSILVLTMGILLGAELLNTTIEEIMDHVSPEQDEAVRIIKDVAAGFVLIMGLTTLFIAFLIFGGRFFP